MSGLWGGEGALFPNFEFLLASPPGGPAGYSFMSQRDSPLSGWSAMLSQGDI